MAVICATTATEHVEPGERGSQRLIVRGQLDRIAGIYLGRLIELSMALGGRIGPQAPNPLAPDLFATESVGKVARVRTVDHVVRGRCIRGTVHSLDCALQRISGREPAVRLNRE